MKLDNHSDNAFSVSVLLGLYDELNTGDDEGEEWEANAEISVLAVEEFFQRSKNPLLVPYAISCTKIDMAGFSSSSQGVFK